jgi:superfamily II DNA or RNA helicase
VLAAADKRLTEVRRGVPDAGGLVIATDQAAARAYAAVLRNVTGEAPVLVLSDDAGSSERIEEFAEGEQRWMVAVRMVSEGVDVPRLAVGVYATSASTPLYFAQAVGRFVRARRRGETASIFLPSVPVLLQLAGELEAERDHALDRPKSAEDGEWSPEEGLIERANQAEGASDDLEGSFKALNSQASFDHVLFDGGQFGIGAEIGSEEELDFLGIPGLLEPDQVATLLRQRQSKHARKRKPSAGGGAGASGQNDRADGVPDVAAHRKASALRKELNSLVAAWARRTGQPHGVVHAELRRVSGGGEVARATTEQLQERIDTLRRWFVGKK